jgi:hypothetical protein
MIGDAVKYIKNVATDLNITRETIVHMISAIDEQIQSIDMCLDAMEREREAIQLSPA